MDGPQRTGPTGLPFANHESKRIELTLLKETISIDLFGETLLKRMRTTSTTEVWS